MRIIAWNITVFSLSTIVQPKIKERIRDESINEEHLNYPSIRDYPDSPRIGPWKTINLGRGTWPKIICIAEIAMGGELEGAFRNTDIERPSDIFVLIEPQHGTTQRGLAAVKILTSVMPRTETQEWNYTYQEVSNSEIIAVLYNAKVVQAEIIEIGQPEGIDPEVLHSIAVPVRTEERGGTGRGWRKALQVNFKRVQSGQGSLPDHFSLVAVHSAEKAAVAYAKGLFATLNRKLSDPRSVPPVYRPLIICGDFNCDRDSLLTEANRLWPGSNDVGVEDVTTVAKHDPKSLDHFVTILHEDTPHTARIDLLDQLKRSLLCLPPTPGGFVFTPELVRLRYLAWFGSGKSHAHLPISWEPRKLPRVKESKP